LKDTRQIRVNGQLFLNEMKHASKLVFSFMIILAMIIFPTMYSMITRPLKRLINATQELAAGNFDVQVTQSHEKSINRLIISFNRMIRELLDNRERLLAAERAAIRQEMESKRMHDELDLARHIQEAFLPKQIHQPEGCSLAARQRFCMEVAGDYHDVIELPDGRIVLAVGDVSGKGAGPALIMANLQAALRTALRVGGELEALVSEINSFLCQNTPDESFVTFFIAVYDNRTQRLEYINAGHNFPLVRHKDGRFDELNVGGPVLGVLPGVPYESGVAELKVGDLLLIYTDGLNEAENENEEQYGEERIHLQLEKNAGESANRILDAMEESVLAHNGSTQLADDLTLMLLKIIP